MTQTIGDTLARTAEKFPHKDAVIYPRRGQRWTYQELDAKSNQLANALADMGADEGDRIATMLHNGSEFILTLFACAKLGAVFTPLNYRLSSEQVSYILNDAGATILVFEDATREVVVSARQDVEMVTDILHIDGDRPAFATPFYEALNTARDTRPDRTVSSEHIYALLYTSGTTGLPKGVVHEHRDILEHNLIFIAESELRRDDIGLSTFPLYHAGELHGGLLPRIQLGATNVVHHDFDPRRVIKAIDRYGVTVLFAAPTGWRAITQAAAELDADVSPLKQGLYGAAPIPQELIERCMDVFDAGFLQAYGMTELGPCVTFQYPEDQLDKHGSAGLPALNHDLRIVELESDPPDELPPEEIGEIIVAGPCMMREYWNQPDATAATIREHDGKEWYYTGDLGYLDEDNYLYVVDRKDDLIISGGENIYPTEVENLLRSHPGVTDVGVLGEPDERWGERVVAHVVGDTSAEELDRYVRDNDGLADFKRPRHYYFVDELPTTATGKVQKFKLRGDGDRPSPTDDGS